MKTLRSITRFAIPALLCLSLAACGGGGGSSGTSTGTSPGSNTNGGNNTNGGGNNTNGGGSNTNGGGGTVTGGSTTPSFTVSGLATGFSGTLGLLDNGTDHLQLKQPGYFTFANSVSSGSSYDVTVAVQPPLQFCSATSASGKATGNVTNVLVGCSPGQFSIPYSFSSTGTGNVNTDGAGPVGGLAEGPDGTLYAATSRGGSAGNGAIIAYTPGAQGVSTILSFGGTGSAGATPDSGVVVTQASPGSLNLYGVAYSGGTSTASGYCGTVYNLYTEVPYLYLLQSLHDFNDTSDGCHPDSRLLLQSNQSFDGTALSGGVAGGGTLYNIAQSGAFTVLIDFPFSATTGGLAGPEFGLTEDDGIVYGVATQGGANGAGGIYTYSAHASGATDATFAYLPSGSTPSGGLVDNSDGMFYGVSSTGGANGKGFVYRFSDAGNTSVPTLQPYYSFTGGADGGSPVGTPLPLSNGDLLIATQSGGGLGGGTVDEIDPSNATLVQVLGNFSSGSLPAGSVTLLSDGLVFGVTQSGGTNSTGSIFEID